MGDELVSRISYQCNNRSTGLHIKPIQPCRWSCLHSSSYTLPIGVMRDTVALHVSGCQSWSQNQEVGGGFAHPG